MWAFICSFPNCKIRRWEKWSPVSLPELIVYWSITWEFSLLQRYFTNPLSHVLNLFLYRFPIVNLFYIKSHSDEEIKSLGWKGFLVISFLFFFLTKCHKLAQFSLPVHISRKTCTQPHSKDPYHIACPVFLRSRHAVSSPPMMNLLRGNKKPDQRPNTTRIKAWMVSIIHISSAPSSAAQQSTCEAVMILRSRFLDARWVRRACLGGNHSGVRIQAGPLQRLQSLCSRLSQVVAWERSGKGRLQASIAMGFM